MNMLPVLIVEDDPDLREALSDTLRLSGYEVRVARDGEDALRVLGKEKIGLVVSDVQMKPMDGHTLLREIKQRYPYLPVLLMTAYGVIEKAVEAMRMGACNYIPKPFEPDALLAEVARFMLPAYADADEAVIAQDPHMEALLDLARRVATSDTTVLITGESGTGKEVLARYIHRYSARAGKPFVAINCAAIPENLLESTLFGHEKGAFTGATQAQAGKFEQAQGGTILLDEISEMSLALQAKLLRVLQEREVERVGSGKPIPLDIRVLAASNRDMAEFVAEGGFREDLYYRLNVFPLHLPALRERPRDIVPLAQHVMRRSARNRAFTLSAAAQAQLTQYHWKGNIRELENVMQRAMILAPGDVIEPEHLHLPKPVRQSVATAPAGTTDMKSLERAHILETLEAVGGSRKLAAQRLGIGERTLRYKLQMYREEGSLKEGEAQADKGGG
ncbi:MAG: sigma-54 dependent transcriptional regulator [Pseudomonadota bacterium]